MPNLSRKQWSEVYRPVGPKQIVAGQPATPGTQLNLIQQVDLTLPIEGFRLRLQGRDVIGGANMASTRPEGYLNLLSRIIISGTNKRMGGNVTLLDLDLATLWVMQWLHSFQPNYFDGVAAAGTVVPDPTTPFPAYGAVAQATYDYRIVVDIPFYPFGLPEAGRPGFLMRNEEWLDSVQFQLTFPAVANAAVDTPLGTGAAATTHVFTAYASAAGNPTIDIESLPVQMGLTLKDAVVPAVLTRTQQPINVILQAAGAPVTLLNLQKQRTTRIYTKIGTATTPPAMVTLSDVNATALAVIMGGNRNVRNLLSVFDHKLSVARQYQTRFIQGYNCFDFVQSGNPDSAFPGHDVGEGATLQLQANVAGVVNAYGIIVQEMILHPAGGALYGG
jgi:hypothetical protein